MTSDKNFDHLMFYVQRIHRVTRFSVCLRFWTPRSASRWIFSPCTKFIVSVRFQEATKYYNITAYLCRWISPFVFPHWIAKWISNARVDKGKRMTKISFLINKMSWDWEQLAFFCSISLLFNGWHFEVSKRVKNEFKYENVECRHLLSVHLITVFTVHGFCCQQLNNI